MLYETLSHPHLFIVFTITGILSGFIFDIGNFIKFLFGNKKVACFFIDFIQTSLCLCSLFISNLTYNYGILRVFPLIIFLISFTIERFTIGKLVAKIYLSCYNKLTKFNKILWSKLKNDKTNKTN